jgi:hypothetical protein
VGYGELAGLAPRTGACFSVSSGSVP